MNIIDRNRHCHPVGAGEVWPGDVLSLCGEGTLVVPRVGPYLFKNWR